jgi:protein involved in polysaccharide export with SLBB domain
MPNGRAPIGAAILSCAVFLSLAQASEAQSPSAVSKNGQTPGLAAPRVSAARSLSPAPSADRYELGPGDLVRIRFSGREDLSGEYRVRGDGGLALRALGAFQVRGKDADELRQDIVASVAAATGAGPRVVVEVIERRPLYVAGLVNKPGAVAYAPAMTVSHAIALAGGLLRTPVADTSIAQFASVSAEIARLKQAETALKRLVARQARLQAERERRSVVAIPEILIDLAGRAEAETLLSGEVRVQRSRAAGFVERRQQHVETTAGIRTEIRELEARMRRAKTSRSTDLRLDDLSALRARAYRMLEEAEVAVKTLDLDQERVIEQEIAETQEQIAAAELDIGAAKTLIEQVTGIPVDPAAASQDVEVKYTIIRYDDDRYLHIDADETLLLRADDVLRVSLKSPRRRTVAERMRRPAGNAPPGH